MTARVRVSLGGLHGQGQRMLIDRDDWEDVVRVLGDAWSVLKDGEGRLRVYSSRAQAKRGGVPYSNSQGLMLARWLLKPQDGQHAFHRDSDTLNLTRENLTTNHPGRGQGGVSVVEVAA